MVAGDRVITCAHVVNLALDRHTFEQQLPDEADGAVVGLQAALPGRGAPIRLRVALEHWFPPRRSTDEPAVAGDIEWADDLAVLRLLDPVPDGPTGPGLGDHRLGPSAFAWFGSGAASSVAAVLVQGVTDRWLVLDTPVSSQNLIEGFSGSPLWDREQQRVVGLVVSRRGERAFAIPAQAITARIPWLAVAAPSAGDRTPPDAHRDHLLDAVRRILPTAAARLDAAAGLLGELGSRQRPEGGAPAPEWFVRTASAHSHGTATLAAVLAAWVTAPEERALLQARAVLAAPDELLTAREYHQLLELLADHPGRPSALAARALPLGPLWEDLDWPALVAHLEGYRPRQGSLPSLLRVVEAAAREAAGPAADGLRDWNDAVAARLGVAAALAERRTLAAETARAASPGRGRPAPVVQLQLWRTGTADAFGAILQERAADGTVRRRICHDIPVARSLVQELLADFLAEAVRGSVPGTLPTVEVFVQRDQLDLDVDRWVYRPDELFPGVLGEDFQVVLRCPELRRPEYWPELRYRWQVRHTGPVLAQERRDPAVQERGRPRPVAGVALCGPPADTSVLRAIALAVGVPAVVWPRPAAGRDAPRFLRELASGLTAAQLPRAVYEARLGATDGGPGRHLALVYDGPDGLPPVLPLGDPA
ncbi:trypsin-like peptidase domain-containing protein [Kitasatospora sp. NPDC093679]|uniref:VMAP-C domain-containing protein n=1 Tax=Kitasatospora sp. NPDC093679 TaxID=3154983 RepID=UPI00343C6FB3